MARAKTPDALDFLYRPLSPSQQLAEERWRDSRILFFFGPAGTGKSTAALGMAVREALKAVGREAHNRQKIWLARPTVTCDEPLGFLPGDLGEKLQPWLAPLHDCFGDLSNSTWEMLEKTLSIEAVAVGMLRGRTIRNGTLIIDEGQQLTYAQLKCAVTRLGRDSRICVCGDPDQSDIFDPKKSPLLDVAKRLAGLDEVAVVKFSEQLRDPLISDILDRL
jgi:phosphate starvation-inducible PhoH-like protein